MRDPGEVRGVRDGGTVQRPRRGADHDVGDDAAFEHRPQHPDLGDALVAATRQDERGAGAPGLAAPRWSANGRHVREATHLDPQPARRMGAVGVHPSMVAPEHESDLCPQGRSPIPTVKKAHAYTPRRSPLGPVPEPRVTEFYRQYLAVAVFVVAAFVMVGAMLGIARLLRPVNPQADKYVTYESGSDPLPLFGQANVRYYIYALLFVIFDVEAVFIFPWAIDVDGLGWFGLVEMTIFIVVLLLGLAYVWRKGLLKWA